MMVINILLNYNILFNVEQPFTFMEMISLKGKSNFFEKRETSYSRVGVGQNEEDRTIGFDEDF